VTTEPMYSNSHTISTGTSAIGTTATAVLTFPATYATTARLYVGKCHIIWQQLTAISTVTFSVGASVAPTYMYVTSQTSAGAYIAPFVAANITSVTTTPYTAITSAIAPTAFGTNYITDIDVALSATAAANTITLYGISGNAADTITVQAGSYCTWLP
jgi:hypothetical protein